MNFDIIYFCVLLSLAAVVWIVFYIIDSRMLYDIWIDDDFIEGCQCEFHHMRHEIEIRNPETGRVIVTNYHHYSIERTYFKGRKGRCEDDE